MEPNAVPGFTNRRIAPASCARALISFPETARYFPGRAHRAHRAARARGVLRICRPSRAGDVLNILITGGSQGSRTLNEAARESWPLFREAGCRCGSCTRPGAAAYEELARRVRPHGPRGRGGRRSSRTCRPPSPQADLVVCRSGAGAVAELAAAGKPSMLVPFPFRRRRAPVAQRRGLRARRRGAAGARRGDDRRASCSRIVRELAADAERAGAHGRRRARRLARPGAARRAADILEE